MFSKRRLHEIWSERYREGPNDIATLVVLGIEGPSYENGRIILPFELPSTNQIKGVPTAAATCLFVRYEHVHVSTLPTIYVIDERYFAANVRPVTSATIQKNAERSIPVKAETIEGLGRRVRLLRGGRERGGEQEQDRQPRPGYCGAAAQILSS
jgi:hypothetical protein